MLFRSFVDLSAKFNFIKKLENGFYQIMITTEGFTYKQSSIQAISVEEVAHLYMMRRLEPNFDCFVKTIPQETFYEKIDEFSSAYGPVGIADIAFEKNSTLALTTAQSIKHELVSFLKTDVFTCIEVEAQRYRLDFPWGICTILLNETNSTGMMLYLAPIA